MIGSLWTGISGLTAQQAALDNEANNIANVNTIGYKSSRISFSDQMYQNDIGKGVEVQDAEKVFTQGSTKVTGNSYDVSLEGDGFFVVQNESVGGLSEQFYTRAGNFRVDDSGFLTDSAGNDVMGWSMITPSITKNDDAGVQAAVDPQYQIHETGSIVAFADAPKYQIHTTDSFIDFTGAYDLASITIDDETIEVQVGETYNGVTLTSSSSGTEIATALAYKADSALYDYDIQVASTDKIQITANNYDVNKTITASTTVNGVVTAINGTTGTNGVPVDNASITVNGIETTVQTGDTINGITLSAGSSDAAVATALAYKANESLDDFVITVTNTNKLTATSQVYAPNKRITAENTVGSASGIVTTAINGATTQKGIVEIAAADADTQFTNEYISLIDSKIINHAEEVETITMRVTDYSNANSESVAAIEEALSAYRIALSEYQQDPTVSSNLTSLESKRSEVYTATSNAVQDDGYGGVQQMRVRAMETVISVSNAAINTKSSMQIELDVLGISDSSFADLTVTDDGLLMMRQDGADYVIGQLSIAKFSNNRGLEPIGGNMFRANSLSGEAQFVTNNNQMATVNGGTLEQSTADLSESLVNMIVYQRAFEANAKTITASDEILTTLLGIKR